jgi:NAD-dependent DNA ligase
MADKVYTSIHDKVDKSSLAAIMAVSNIFGRGFGEKRINPILVQFPNILTSESSDVDKMTMIKSIKGMEKKTAERFVANIPKFMEFIKVAKLEYKITDLPQPVEKDTSNPLYNKSIVITGFRNKELSEELKQIGSNESSAVSKNTFAVIIKSKEGLDTGKVESARKKGIPIYSIEEFKEKYDLSISL